MRKNFLPIAILVILIIGATAAYAQTLPTIQPSPFQLEEPSVEAVETEAQAVDSLAPATAEQLSVSTFLPLMYTPPAVENPQAAINNNCDENFQFIPMTNDQLVLTTSPRQMGILAQANGFRGSTYRAVWVINGAEQSSLTRTGSVTSDSQLLISPTIVFTTGLSCQDRFPAGTYQVQFYIDDQLELTPTIFIN